MDWISIISELTKRGLTQGQIAGACQCSQAAISEISTGKVKDPRYSLCQALLVLYQQPAVQLRGPLVATEPAKAA
ncbi:helix-turn-helix domain-containing protein [Variovorax soli]|uniref:helix-turn-helix domain-containing protein n=1 Tax=Variovorax soli TaxID=376815 RepID=UPI003571278C